MGKRHSDGKLYFADVVGNQGTIHVISTTKTTVEGDTDAGSAASKLTFGYGLFPTALESYGGNLVIALNEGYDGGAWSTGRAKVAFWDTTSASFNSIVWVEFPDTRITAMKNINGVLYVVSSNVTASATVHTDGFRVSRYVGGTTFEEVQYVENGSSPMPGAIDGDSKRLLFGSYTQVPTKAACVYSLGLQNSALGSGLFTPIRATVNETGTSGLSVTALELNRSGPARFGLDTPLIGWGGATQGGGIDAAFDYFTYTYGTVNAIFWSQLYKIGQPFEIKRIRIPLAQTIAPGMVVQPTLYFDDGISSQALRQINTNNIGTSAETGFGRVANIKTAGDGTNIMRGQNNFWLELTWSGGTLCTIGLPIIIDFDIIPD